MKPLCQLERCFWLRANRLIRLMKHKAERGWCSLILFPESKATKEVEVMQLLILFATEEKGKDKWICVL